MRAVALLALLALARGALPPSTRRGFVSLGFTSTVMQQPATLAVLKDVASDGADWVAVEPVLNQASLNASVVYVGQYSPSDDSLRTYIRAARALGMRVALKVLLTIDDGSSWVYVAPANASSWFQSYSDMLVHYATLGAAEGASTFCLGTELAHLTVHAEYEPYWRQLIGNVRQAAPSLELTYAALYAVEYPNVTFWDALDAIGVDAYFPLTTPDVPSPSLLALLSAWSLHLDALAQWRNSRGLGNRPILFMEVGYASYTGTTVQPSRVPDNCTGAFSANFTAQAEAYSALFTAAAGRPEVVAGIFLFWMDNPSTSDWAPTGHKWPCFYTPRGKPAMAVLQAAYGGSPVPS